jgi:dihydroorotase
MKRLPDGEVVYGKPKTEKMIILEDIAFTIPDKYPTNIAGLDIVPMWAGKEIGWSLI